MAYIQTNIPAVSKYQRKTTYVMLIECHGITKDTYYIPPFSVSPGEVVVLFLYGGPHYYDLASWLTNIFTGKITHPQVTIHQPLQHVEYSRKRAFKNLFLPATIKDYLKSTQGRTRELQKEYTTWAILIKKHVLIPSTATGEKPFVCIRPCLILKT